MLSATTNTAALTAQRFLSSSADSASSSIAKMSSGSRIVKASDDASSLAIGNKLRADIAALQQAGRNASQGASLLQVANGAMDRINDILTRMKTLATQVVNGTLSTSERQYAQQEFGQLVTQVDQITEQTRWNGVSMLNGGDKTLATTNTLGGNIAGGVTGLDAVATTNFTAATAFDATGYTGNVTGSVSDVRVTDIGGQYKVAIDVGVQTFVGYVDDTAPAGTQIEFRSTSNDHNGFRMLTSNNAVGTATALETDMENLFQLDSTTAPPASLQSAAFTDANAAAVFNAGAAGLADVMRANGSSVDGIYTVTSRYDADSDTVTFRMMHENGEVYNASLINPNGVAAADTRTIVFSNGVEFTATGAVINNLDTGNIDGIRFEVDRGNATSMTFQVGVLDTDLLDISFASMTAGSLGLDVLNVETLAGGQNASRVVTDAISKVNNAQAQIGAIQSRMEYVESNLATIIENLSAAKGIFLDVDMAMEMTEFTKHQTLMSAGVAMLAQANQMPKELLQLIRG